ncbi:MAG: hypothetical protein SVV03_03080 [Candidatus Nanohaloarchaea archaeon]|nr:hypothetical protein [Candidatus Nanohaloarchaea archaeon]
MRISKKLKATAVLMAVLVLLLPVTTAQNTRFLGDIAKGRSKQLRSEFDPDKGLITSTAFTDVQLNGESVDEQGGTKDQRITLKLNPGINWISSPGIGGINRGEIERCTGFNGIETLDKGANNLNKEKESYSSMERTFLSPVKGYRVNLGSGCKIVENDPFPTDKGIIESDSSLEPGFNLISVPYETSLNKVEGNCDIQSIKQMDTSSSSGITETLDPKKAYAVKVDNNCKLDFKECGEVKYTSNSISAQEGPDCAGEGDKVEVERNDQGKVTKAEWEGPNGKSMEIKRQKNDAGQYLNRGRLRADTDGDGESEIDKLVKLAKAAAMLIAVMKKAGVIGEIKGLFGGATKADLQAAAKNNNFGKAKEIAKELGYEGTQLYKDLQHPTKEGSWRRLNNLDENYGNLLPRGTEGQGGIGDLKQTESQKEERQKEERREELTKKVWDKYNELTESMREVVKKPAAEKDMEGDKASSGVNEDNTLAEKCGPGTSEFAKGKHMRLCIPK